MWLGRAAWFSKLQLQKGKKQWPPSPGPTIHAFANFASSARLGLDVRHRNNKGVGIDSPSRAVFRLARMLPDHRDCYALTAIASILPQNTRGILFFLRLQYTI